MPQVAKAPRQKPSTLIADVMTLQETADYLRFSPKKVEEWVANHGLPGRKLGKDWRFLRAAIVRWLDPAGAYQGPSDAQCGALANDPTFDDMLQRLESYRRGNGAERA